MESVNIARVEKMLLVLDCIILLITQTTVGIKAVAFETDWSKISTELRIQMQESSDEQIDVIIWLSDYYR